MVSTAWLSVNLVRMFSMSSTKDIAFSSNLPTDKIVGVYEGSFAPGSSPVIGDPFLAQVRRHTIVHGFTRPVFTKLLASTDNTIWQDGGARSDALAYSDATNIYIITPLTSGTIYYKVIAFWIDDYDTTNPAVSPTVNTNSLVYFDSRLNYQKVFNQATATHASGIGAHSSTVTHSLGYAPNARVYFEAFPNQIWPANFGGVGNIWLIDFAQVECEYSVTTTTLTINTYGGVSSPTRRVWSVVYYDDWYPIRQSYYVFFSRSISEPRKAYWVDSYRREYYGV